MRLPYLRFANVVARARREVLREFPQPIVREAPVIAYSVEANIMDEAAGIAAVVPWGETWQPKGPVIIWQQPYEEMPDQENYYRQIKAVIRHEFGHLLGDTHEDEYGRPPARVVAA